jgi:hypothetical protein
VLYRPDQVKEVRPFTVCERGASAFAVALWNGGEDERLSTDCGQPVRVTVDVCELWSAHGMVMENRMHLAGDHLQALPAEQRAGLVAAVWKKTGWAGRDGTLSHGCRFGQHAFGVELMPPVRGRADPPAHRRKGKSMD